MDRRQQKLKDAKVGSIDDTVQEIEDVGIDHFQGLREVTDVFLDQSPIHLESIEDITPKKEFPQMTEARRSKTHH